jgi:glycosyltransferase involved in cell wall biosynthesis
MNILQLTNKIPYPPNDGGAIATLNMSKGFTYLGHHVTILSMNTSKHYFKIDDIPEKIRNTIQIIAVDIDSEITPAGALNNLLFSGLPYSAERFISRAFSDRLSELLTAEHFDIVQIEGLYLTHYIPVIRKFSKAIISFRSHNIEHEIWERTADRQKNPVKKIYLRILAKRIKEFKRNILNTYDLLIPITQRDADIYSNNGNLAPVCVVPAGINFKEMSLPYPRDIEPSVCYIGALDWIPNQDGLTWFLKSVWPGILNFMPGIQFHIAGRNAPVKFAGYLNNQPGVVYHGEINDAYSFMVKYSVMIVPLFSGSGMRVKIIEGMALKRLVVSTPKGAEGIGAIHNENILIAENTDEFINAVSSALSDPVLYTKISENAKVFTESNFDNEKICAKLISFYESRLAS